MTAHRIVLRRVGWVLIGLGVADIGFMFYCIANDISYASSINIFSVIAGIFLLRGHLGAARMVTWFAAFMFTGYLIAVVAVFPWVKPLDYSVLVFRLNPVGAFISVLFAVLFLVWLLWVYRELRSSSVVDALVVAGHKHSAPTSAFMTGGAIALALAVLLQLTMKGDSADEAVRRARQQHGHNYNYFVSNIHWAGSGVSAKLTAYNDTEIKEVKVEWTNE